MPIQQKVVDSKKANPVNGFDENWGRAILSPDIDGLSFQNRYSYVTGTINYCRLFYSGSDSMRPTR